MAGMSSLHSQSGGGSRGDASLPGLGIWLWRVGVALCPWCGDTWGREAPPAASTGPAPTHPPTNLTGHESCDAGDQGHTTQHRVMAEREDHLFLSPAEARGCLLLGRAETAFTAAHISRIWISGVSREKQELWPREPRLPHGNCGQTDRQLHPGQGHATLPQFPLVCSRMLPPRGLLGCLSLSLPTTVTASTGSLSLNRLDVWEAVTLQGRLHPTPGGYS